MAEPFLGQIISVGFNFAPVGWYPCDGRKLPISQYETLFQMLGTQYGGDGVTDFALPNLNGRVPLGVGQGPSLSPYVQGQAMGSESVTLLSVNTPPHSHTIDVSSAAALSVSPKAGSTVGANATAGLPGVYAAGPGTVPLRGGSLTYSQGGNQPHENRQQFLVLNYIIAWTGLYPSQS